MTSADVTHHRLHHADGLHRGGLKKISKGSQRLANDWRGPSVSEAIGSQVQTQSQLPLTIPTVTSAPHLQSLTAPPIEQSVNRSHVAVNPAPIAELALATSGTFSAARSNRVMEFIGSDQEPVIEMDPAQVTMMAEVDQVAYDMLNASTNQPSSPESVASHVTQRVVELSRSIRKAGVSMNSPSLFTDAHHQSHAIRQEEPLQLARAMSQMVVSSVSKRLQFDAVPLAESASPYTHASPTLVRSPSIRSTSSDITSSAASSIVDVSVDTSMTSTSRQSASASVSSYVSKSASAQLSRDWKVITYVPSAFIVIELHGLPHGLPPMKVITQWWSMFPEYERQSVSQQKSLRSLWTNVSGPVVNRRRVHRAQWNAVYDEHPDAIQYIQDHLTFGVLEQMAIEYNSTIGCQPGQQMVDVIRSQRRVHAHTLEWSMALQEQLFDRFKEYIARRAATGNGVPAKRSTVSPIEAPVLDATVTRNQMQEETELEAALEAIVPERKKKKQKTEQ
jgi:hypothetical protein